MIDYIFKKLIPPTILEDVYESFVAKSIVGTGFIAIIAFPFFALLNHSVGYITEAYVDLIECAIVLSASFAMKYTESIAVGREIIVGSLTAFLLFLNYSYGGATSPTICWLALTPFMAIFLGSVRSGIVWSSIISIIVIVFYFFFSNEGVVYSPHQDARNLLALTSIIGLMYVVIGFSFFFDKGKKESLDKLYYLAFHDALTDLANRPAFEKELENLIKENNSRFSLFYFDIDNFKTINDNLGHRMGDLLLIELTRRIKKCLSESDIFARIGGDEFNILVKTEDHQILLDIVKNIMSAAKEPFFIEGHEIIISISVGIAKYPYDATWSLSLIRNADIALNLAKKSGKNNFQFYVANAAEKENLRLQTEYELTKAIINQELSLVYQPQFDANNTKKIVGVEALVRWSSAKLGLVYPEDFISIAERMGLINEIDRWVLVNACKDYKKWKNSNLLPEDKRISINISSEHLHNYDFIKTLQQTIESNDLNPFDIQLEITETQLMYNQAQTINNLNEIAALGITLAVDDFGSGYSSFEYLKRLPVSTLKIGQSFIKEIENSKKDSIIVKTIIDLSKNLELKTVAEGVETLEQLKILQKSHCDYIQGFYLGKPMKTDDFKQLLINSRQQH